jgi:hypothetical protein
MCADPRILPHLHRPTAAQINTALFPSFGAMTSYGHARNLTVGWYGNNCRCADHCTDTSCYQGGLVWSDVCARGSLRMGRVPA